jgi:hypothetical protein
MRVRYLRHLSGGAVEIMKHFNKDISCPGRNSNRRSPEQKTRVTTGAKLGS